MGTYSFLIFWDNDFTYNKKIMFLFQFFTLSAHLELVAYLINLQIDLNI